MDREREGEIQSGKEAREGVELEREGKRAREVNQRSETRMRCRERERERRRKGARKQGVRGHLCGFSAELQPLCD